MNRSALDNLVKIHQLKLEPSDASEVARLPAMAVTRLGDARQSGVSLEGRFSSAYTAAHAAALACLRHSGYRSENRYLMFQCLEHTLHWPAIRWRILTAAHDARNRAECEGFFEVGEHGLTELIVVADELIMAACSVCPPSSARLPEGLTWKSPVLPIMRIYDNIQITIIKPAVSN